MNTVRLLTKRSKALGICHSTRPQCSSSPVILGIETSCDDTGIGIVTGSKKIIGECVKSQQAYTTKFGGVIPLFAVTQHETNLNLAYREALDQTGLSINDIDAVAVTVRPGLIVCLHKGLQFALNLCRTHNKPMIPIHHMQAHALTARLTNNVDFPYMCLLISGGHALIVWVESAFKFKIIGSNQDAAPGEVFDKIARRLQLSHIDALAGRMSGGALIERFSENGDPLAFEITMPNLKRPDCNFSFSGIASSFLYKISTEEAKLDLNAGISRLPNIPDFCASLQHTIFKHLAKKVMRAFEYVKLKNWCSSEAEEDKREYPHSLVISGGVAANQYIRNGFEYVCSKYDCKLVCPPQKYCTDNGVMIAWNGVQKWMGDQDLIYNLPLSYYLESKYPMGENVECDVARCALTREILRKTRSSFKLNVDFGGFSAQNINANHVADDQAAEKDLSVAACYHS